MTDSHPEDEESATAVASTDVAAKRAARREAARKEWMAKRAAEEAAKPPPIELSPAEKLLDAALTPAYVAIGAAVIAYRILRGLPAVTDDDYEDE